MRIREQSLSKKSAPDEGRRRIKNIKSKYENFSTEHKLILTHFCENLNFFDKINLHLNSFPHHQQKAASREGGLASWLS
jgi:hypothetical protein